MAGTALVTFFFETSPSTATVELLGSWDNFSRAYTLERDPRRGPGQWVGCHAFTDIICDGNPREAGTKRDGGLKMGGTYWYFYRLDGDGESYDQRKPFTTSCPLLPGQRLNILEVPVEDLLDEEQCSPKTTSAHIHTLDPQDRYRTPRPNKFTRAPSDRSREQPSLPGPPNTPQTPLPSASLISTTDRPKSRDVFPPRDISPPHDVSPPRAPPRCVTPVSSPTPGPQSDEPAHFKLERKGSITKATTAVRSALQRFRTSPSKKPAAEQELACESACADPPVEEADVSSTVPAEEPSISDESRPDSPQPSSTPPDAISPEMSPARSKVTEYSPLRSHPIHDAVDTIETPIFQGPSPSRILNYEIDPLDSPYGMYDMGPSYLPYMNDGFERPYLRSFARPRLSYFARSRDWLAMEAARLSKIPEEIKEVEAGYEASTKFQSAVSALAAHLARLQEEGDLDDTEEEEDEEIRAVALHQQDEERDGVSEKSHHLVSHQSRPLSLEGSRASQLQDGPEVVTENEMSADELSSDSTSNTSSYDLGQDLACEGAKTEDASEEHQMSPRNPLMPADTESSRGLERLRSPYSANLARSSSGPATPLRLSRSCESGFPFRTSEDGLSRSLTWDHPEGEVPMIEVDDLRFAEPPQPGSRRQVTCFGISERFSGYSLPPDEISSNATLSKISNHVSAIVRAASPQIMGTFAIPQPMESIHGPPLTNMEELMNDFGYLGGAVL